jgi:hypothetical protein
MAYLLRAQSSAALFTGLQTGNVFLKYIGYGASGDELNCNLDVKNTIIIHCIPKKKSPHAIILVGMNLSLLYIIYDLSIYLNEHWFHFVNTRVYRWK